jgi:hypothetical protein
LFANEGDCDGVLSLGTNAYRFNERDATAQINVIRSGPVEKSLAANFETSKAQLYEVLDATPDRGYFELDHATNFARRFYRIRQKP